MYIENSMTKNIDDSISRRNKIPKYKFDKESEYTIKINNNSDDTEIIKDIKSIVQDKELYEGYYFSRVNKEEGKSVEYLLDIGENQVEYVDSYLTLENTGENIENHKEIAYNYYSILKEFSYGYEIHVQPCFSKPLPYGKICIEYHTIEQFGIYKTRNEAIEAFYNFRKNKWNKDICKDYYQFNKTECINNEFKIMYDVPYETFISFAFYEPYCIRYY